MSASTRPPTERPDRGPCPEPDCGLDAALHAEIAETLRADELDVFARADLAADAIDMAEAEAWVDRPRKPAWRYAAASVAAMAALVLILVGPDLFALLRDDPEPGPPEEDALEVAAGSVAQERAANIAFLDDPRTRARIAAVEDGHWIGIQHGRTMLVADELGKLDVLLKRSERDDPTSSMRGVRPRALHRFTFRKGSEGDRSYRTFVGKPPFVGAAFINRFGFHVSMGDGRVRYARYRGEKLQGEVLDVPLREGRGAELPMHIGEPTSLGGLAFRVGYSTASTNPLVLPNGMGFPRFEIPGTATLTGGSDHPGTFRRYVASISIPRMDLREVFVEAIGHPAVLEQEDGSLRIGNQTWQPDTPARRLGAAEAGRPVLLLERQRWMARHPGNPFAGLPQEGLDAALAPFDLLWKELPDKSDWAGHSHDAPPAESRLTLLDPRSGVGVIRTLVVRPWTSQRHVTTLLSAGLARFEAGPRRGVEGIAENEAVAVRILRAIHRAQESAKAKALVDANGNGVGEYMTLAELTGYAEGRLKAKLRPPMLPISFAPRATAGDLAMNGYRVRVFFPARDDIRIVPVARHREPGGREGFHTGQEEFLPPYTTAPAADSSNLDPAEAERRWWAYAWPEELEVTGRRAFYVDQDGAVWATDATAGAYEGTHAAPPADAAFATPGRYPGAVSPALESADGHRWTQVP